MAQAYRITEAQKDELIGHEWTPDDYFYPIQDVNNDWFISIQEVDGYEGTDYPWFSSLVLEDFVAKPPYIPETN